MHYPLLGGVAGVNKSRHADTLYQKQSESTHTVATEPVMTFVYMTYCTMYNVALAPTVTDSGFKRRLKLFFGTLYPHLAKK